MKKFITAMAMTLSLAAIPSFAQYEEDYQEGAPEYDAEGAPEASTEGAPEANASSYDDTYVASEPEPAPAPVAVQQSSSSDNFKMSMRLGGRIAIGVGGADDLNQVNVDFGGSMRIYIMPMVALAPEVNLSIRNFAQSYGADQFMGYYYEFDDSFTELLLDVDVLGRFEPLPFLYAEGGLKLGIGMGSFYSDEWVRYDYKGGQRLGSGSYDVGEWESNSFVAALVLGFGGNVKSHGQDVDVGLRFSWDLNQSTYAYTYNDEKDGNKLKKHKVADARPWSVQLSMTYLL